MKAWWILVAVLAIPSEAAPRRMPPTPPIERNCVGPKAWDDVQKCINTFAKGARVETFSPDVKHVGNTDLRQYLYVRFEDGWRLSYILGDQNYELVQRVPFMIGKTAATRIDLSHHVPVGNEGVFLERVSLVCRSSARGCDAMVTACTVISKGRAVETFRGELRVENDAVTVFGDRSQSGSMCLGR